MDSNLNQLAPITDFDKAYILAQQSHEMGFRGTTFPEMYIWLKGKLDLTGLSNTAGLPEEFPLPGSTLVAANPQDWTILGPGIYNKVISGTITIANDEFGFGQFDGTDFNRVLKIKLPTAPPVTKPDIQLYAYTKDQYVTQKLVDGASAPTIRINDIDVTDSNLKLEMIKKLDQSIKSLRVFGLPEGKYMVVRQMTFDPNGNFSFGIAMVDNEKDDFNTNAMTSIGFFAGSFDYSKPFRADFAQRYSTVSYIGLFDMAPFAGQKVSFNFRNSTGMQSYKTSGLKFSGVNFIPYKSIWGMKYDLRNSNSPYYPESFYLHEAIKRWSITSKEKALVRLQGINYNASNSMYQFIISTCADDEPNNLIVNDSRNKFGFLRINVDKGAIGLKRVKSFSLTAKIDIEIDAIIDISSFTPYLKDLETYNLNIDGSTSLNAHWIVEPNSTNSGGSEVLNSLSLIEGQEDFDSLNFRFTAASNWAYDSSYNMSKIIRIPDGTDSLEFSMQFNGTDTNALILDEDMKLISKAYNGTSVINSLTIAPPPFSKFILLSTSTSKDAAKLMAKGTFVIDKSIKEYRSLHEGLCDKFSGLYFIVNGLTFKKRFEGLCTLNQYDIVSSDYLDDIPEFEKDGGFIIPSNILHTDGLNTYTGGSLCCIKDGVMYFYNAKACAVFKSLDYGQTFQTIVDKYSHPDAWDTQDVNSEGRSVIVVLDDGELLIPIRHRGEIFYQDDQVTRKERFYVLYRTINNQTDLVKCFTFSHEDTIRDWLPEGNSQRNWANHSGGAMLGDFTHYVYKNIVLVTEYGAGTSNYWQHQGISNNARGISGRAWVSFDHGKAGTWKKCFDADRKKSGLSEEDDNWYYFTNYYAGKMRHMHGCHIDEVNGIAHLTNGDYQDYDWNISLSDLKSWYDSAPSIDPNEKPSFKTTDTFPNWKAELLSPGEGNSNYGYSAMKYQMMQGFSYGKKTDRRNWTIWVHDASREFIYASYYDINGKYVFEPILPLEKQGDFATIQEYVNSFVSTDGFGQHLIKHKGTYYIPMSNGGNRPSRVIATRDGFRTKVVYEGENEDIKFAGKIMFDDHDNAYLSNGMLGQDSTQAGFWKLKLKSA
ncbi:hypothetical protein [Sphingobacterium daejeonense]|uniref:hypothetical protein n=1 Tax=Sphingobacterium daejeonense TaxID=371142 RepID=UPI0010C450BC|nr:hypothetical protein [Sphingobacterium daejeonense]VTQ01650.1 Uncharacterised protein [Sphingobacterium daejeonense]